MLYPANYVDLFDRLYPESGLSGFQDSSQITVSGLNERYAHIKNNHRSTMNALSGIVFNSEDGRYLRDFLFPFWEVAAAKSFNFSSQDIINFSFKSGFDARGELLEFPQPMVVCQLTEIGTYLDNKKVVSLVYNNGILLDKADYEFRTTFGGAVIYIKKSLVEVNKKIDIVFLRKYNIYGETSHRVSRTVLDQETLSYLSLNNSSPDDNILYLEDNNRLVLNEALYEFDILIPDLIELGNRYALKYYKLFVKKPTDSYFRPVDFHYWESRPDESLDGAVFTYFGKLEEGEVFQVVNTTEFWEKEGTFTIDNTNEYDFSIDLIMEDNVNPVPAYNEHDLDVYIDGRLLTPIRDYYIIWGGIDCISPPRIVFSKMLSQGTFRYRIIANAPWEPDTSIEYHLPYGRFSDTHAIIELPNNQDIYKPLISNRIPITNSLGLLFSEGSLDSIGTSKSVGGGKAIYLDGLVSKTDIKFRSRFVLTEEAIQVLESNQNCKSPLQQFLEMVNQTPFNFDYISAYIINNQVPLLGNDSKFTSNFVNQENKDRGAKILEGIIFNPTPPVSSLLDCRDYRFSPRCEIGQVDCRSLSNDNYLLADEFENIVADEYGNVIGLPANVSIVLDCR